MAGHPRPRAAGQVPQRRAGDQLPPDDPPGGGPRSPRAAPTWGCLLANHVTSAACIARPSGPGPPSQFTAEGTRLPFLYAPAGAVADLLAGDPTGALLLGRLVFALISLALLAAAVWLCWDGHGTSLIGPAIAITPGVLWAAAMLNPSGPEIGAEVLRRM